jgi:CHAT domain
VLHLSGHGGAGEFLLEHADGSPDPVSTAELIKRLRPLRPRVKLAVVSACQSAAATTAETLRWLGLDDPAADLEAQAAQEATAIPAGVAWALVAELGCVVVAMRYPVIDDFAVDFADELYDRVFRMPSPWTGRSRPPCPPRLEPHCRRPVRRSRPPLWRSSGPRRPGCPWPLRSGHRPWTPLSR